MSTEISTQRTKNYFKQLKGSFVFKLLAILSSFLMIPIMIKYLGNEQYGIWSTLLSILSWIILFDIGIGNGLRNKISESLAKDDTQKAQTYISTAYTIIGFVSIGLIAVFLSISFYIPWQSVFNTEVLSGDDLRVVVTVVALFLFLNFWLSLINQVFNGLQKSSLVVFNQFLSNAFALASVYFLYNFTESSLVKMAFFYGASLLTSNILLSIWFYKNNLKLLPRLKLYSSKHRKSIVSLGFQFFIIQIAVVVIFTTDKILITQLFGPEYVTSYDVVFKLFSIITIAYSMISVPLWGAYSDAHHRKDFAWIKRTIKNQLKIYILVVLVTIVLLFLIKPISLLWVGESVKIDMSLVLAMALFILVSVWNNVFAIFINATNQLSIQIYTSVIAIFINIPISIFLVKYYEMGTYGIVLGTVMSLSLFTIFGSMQTFKILKEYDEKSLS